MQRLERYLDIHINYKTFYENIVSYPSWRITKNGVAKIEPN